MAMKDLSRELGDLETERSRADLADLDMLPTRDLVGRITAEDATVPAVVDAAGDAIASAVDMIVERLRSGGRLIYVGAGTPGRLGVVDAAECIPTFGTAEGLVVAVIAGGAGSMTNSAEGAEDSAAAGTEDLQSIQVGAGDAVVGITASGRTPYVLAALEYAAAAGAATIGISNNRDAALSAVVDVPVEVPTGPEIVAGSTRMKAGTAQKLVLNTLSTASMVRLGKTYGNLMVDVKASNEKLKIRARRIVVEATGATDEAAAAALNDADGQVKTAVVALLAAVPAEEARRRLTAADGYVRTALSKS
ncbi:N-acetylmuramic acid 6-phosphate etherase [Arthrobacter pigmenti]